MDVDDVTRAIHQRLRDHHDIGDAGPHDALLSSALLDSISFTRLECWIEREFGVVFHAGDVMIENADTAILLARLVVRKMAKNGGAQVGRSQSEISCRTS